MMKYSNFDSFCLKKRCLVWITGKYLSADFEIYMSLFRQKEECTNKKGPDKQVKVKSD